MDSQRLYHQNKNLPNTQGKKALFNNDKHKKSNRFNTISRYLVNWNF